VRPFAGPGPLTWSQPGNYVLLDWVGGDGYDSVRMAAKKRKRRQCHVNGHHNGAAEIKARAVTIHRVALAIMLVCCFGGIWGRELWGADRGNLLREVIAHKVSSFYFRCILHKIVGDNISIASCVIL
jgi:hypothetical protein